MPTFSLGQMYSGYKNIIAFSFLSFFFLPILKDCFYGFPHLKWLSWDKQVSHVKKIGQNYFNFILLYKEVHKYIQIHSAAHSMWILKKLSAAHITCYSPPTQRVSNWNTQIDRAGGSKKECPDSIQRNWLFFSAISGHWYEIDEIIL